MENRCLKSVEFQSLNARLIRHMVLGNRSVDKLQREELAFSTFSVNRSWPSFLYVATQRIYRFVIAEMHYGHNYVHTVCLIMLIALLYYM